MLLREEGVNSEKGFPAELLAGVIPYNVLYFAQHKITRTGKILAAKYLEPENL